jgi:uncharacterized protein (DUF433 family)
MYKTIKYSPVVVRTERGLTIAGTRITLYQIMDSLKAGYPPEEVRDDFGLTIRQMNEVMDYIETHGEEFEKEYQQVIALAEANRQYWEERNRERLDEIAKMPPKPEHIAIWNKLRKWKSQPPNQKSLS